jgi:hypothetical protein
VTLIDASIVVLLAGWLLASALAQLPWGWCQAVRRWDAFGIIPSFSFFAPNPASSDCHLLYRHLLDDGSFTRWTEAFVWRPVPWRFLWNPDRRAEKAISDATSGLARRTDAIGVRFAVSYLLLLNYVSALPRSINAVGVQFALMGSSEYSDHDPFARFISDTHPLCDGVPLRSTVKHEAFDHGTT